MAKTKITQELFGVVCERMANGESTTQILKDLSISWGSFAHFAEQTTENAEQYARARDKLLDYHAEEIREISDSKPDYVTDENGSKRVDNGYVTWQKNRVDARKWLLSKLAPKKYGDKITQEVKMDDETAHLLRGRERLKVLKADE